MISLNALALMLNDAFDNASVTIDSDNVQVVFSVDLWCVIDPMPWGTVDIMTVTFDTRKPTHKELKVDSLIPYMKGILKNNAGLIPS